MKQIKIILVFGILLLIIDPPTFEEKLRKRVKENREKFNKKYQDKIDTLTNYYLYNENTNWKPSRTNERL